MKKYPYTDSTDMIIYEAKPKTKKQRPWLVPIVSALTASVLTASAFTVGFMVIDNGRSNELIASDTQEMVASETGDVEVSTLAKYRNGKKVLTIPEIAEKVGPSVVGVINKTTVQAQRMYDPFSGRYYYYQVCNW